MKKAILDDVQTCRAKLQGCKDKVSQALGSKQPAEVLQPLVEVSSMDELNFFVYFILILVRVEFRFLGIHHDHEALQDALQDWKVASEPVRTAEEKLAPKPKAKGKAKAKNATAA